MNSTFADSLLKMQLQSSGGIFSIRKKMGRSCFQQLPMVSGGRCNLSREDSLKNGSHFGGTIFIKRELAETLLS